MNSIIKNPSGFRFLSFLLIVLIFGAFPSFSLAMETFNTPVLVTANPGQNFASSLSGDGRVMVYVSDRSGNLDLWIKQMAPGLQNPDRRLTFHGTEDNSPAVSPDGKKAAFISHRNDPRGDLYVMDISDSPGQTPAPVRLTNTDSTDSHPSWSPDQKFIYFASRPADSLEKSIFKIELATLKKSRVLKKSGLSPAISPDGLQMAFVSEKNLWLMDLKTQAVSAITSNSSIDLSPNWSKDGKHIIFTRYEDDTNRDGELTIDDNPNIVILKLEKGRVVYERQLTASDSYDLFPSITGTRFIYTEQTQKGGAIQSLPLEGLFSKKQNFSEAQQARNELCPPENPVSARCILIYKNMIQDFPGEGKLASIRLALAQAYRELGQSDSARSKLEKIVNLHADRPAVKGLAQIELATLSLKAEREKGPQAYVKAVRSVLKTLSEISGQKEDAVKAKAYIEMGRLYGKLKDPTRALGFFDRVIKQFPKQKIYSAQAAFYKSRIYKLVGDRKSLIASFVTVIRNYYDVKKWRKQATQEILNLFETPQKLAEKISSLQQLTLSYKSLPELSAAIQNRIGSLYAENNESVLAKEAFKTTVSKYPKIGEEVFYAQMSLAEIYAREENFEQSLKTYEKIFDGSEKLKNRINAARKAKIDKWIEKGVWEIRVNEIKLARKTFSRLIEYAPKVVEAHRGYIQAGSALKKVQDNINIYRERLKKDPNSAVDHYALGLAVTYLSPPDLDQAEKEIGIALSKNAVQPFFHQTLGWVYEQKERASKNKGYLEKAIHEYEIALSLVNEKKNPQNAADLFLNLGNAHYLLKSRLTALYYYSKRSRHPFYVADREAIYRQRYGETAFKAGLHETAIIEFRKALKIFEKKKDAARIAELNDRIALAYQDAGEYSNAVEYFSRALKLNRSSNKPRSASRALRNIANNLYSLNEESGEKDPQSLHKALTHYFEAVALLEKHGAIEHKKEKKGLIGVSLETGLGENSSSAATGFDVKGERKLIFHYVGKIYGDFGRYDLAIKNFKNKLSLIPNDLNLDGNVPVLLEKALLLNQIGNYYWLWGKPEESLDYFRQSHALSMALNNHRGTWVNAANIGQITLSLTNKTPFNKIADQIESARELMEKTDKAFKTEPSLTQRKNIALLKNLLGILYFHKTLSGQGELSSGKSQNPVSAISRGLENVNLEFQNAKRSNQYFEQALSLLSEPRLQTDPLTMAIRQNLELSHSLMGNKPAEKSIFPSAEFKWQYIFVESLLKEDEEKLEALKEADRLLSELPYSLIPNDPSSLSLMNDLYCSLTEASFSAGEMEQALIFSEKGRQLQLIALRPKLEFTDDALLEYAEEINRISGEAKKTADSNEPLDDILAEHAEFVELMKEDVPELASIFSADVPDLDLIRSLLEPGQSLIKFQSVKDSILVFELNDEDVQGKRITMSKPLFDAIDRVARRGQSASSKDIEILSSKLLGPINEKLKSTETLMLSADGVLEFLPWSAISFADKPLIESMQLIFISSLSHFRFAEAKNNLFDSRLLLVGADSSCGSVNADKADMQDKRSFDCSIAKEGDFSTVKNIRRNNYRQLMEDWSRYGIVQISGPSYLDGKSAGNIRTSSNPDDLQSIPIQNLYAPAVNSRLLSLSNIRYEFSSDNGLSPTAPLVHALTFKGYPGVLFRSDTKYSQPDESFLNSFLKKLRRNGPPEALRKTQLEFAKQSSGSLDWTRYRYYGFPEMPDEMKEDFAGDRFKRNVGLGAREFKEGEWPSAISYFENALLLGEYLPDNKLIPVLHQKLAESAYNMEDFQKAIDYEKRLIPMAEKNGDKLELARIERFLGIAYSMMEQFPNSISHLKQALELFGSEEAIQEMAESYSQLGLVEENALNYQEALSAFQKSESLHTRLKSEADRAMELRRIGRIYYLRLNQYSEAERYFSQAYSIFSKLEENENTAETLLELGLVNEKRGDFAKALEFYKKGESIATSENLQKTLSRAKLYQANSHWYQADYQKAFQFQKQALDLAEKDNDLHQQSLVYNTLGLIHWTLNDSQRALSNLNKSLELALKVPSLTEAASAYNNIGLVHRKNKRYEESLSYFQKALDYDIKSKSKWGQGYTHRNMGMSYLRLGDLKSAEKHIELAISLSQSIGNQTNLVKALLERGNISLKKGQLEAAASHFKTTGDLAQRLNIPEALWRALRGEAFSLAKLGQKEKAVEIYKKAVATVDQMRAAIKVEEFQNGFLTDKQEVYQELVLLLLDLGKTAESFNYAERSKSRSFIDLLGNQQINLKNDVSQKLFDQLQNQKKLIRKIEDDKALAREQADDERAEKLGTQLIAARNAYQDLIIAAKASSPQISSFVTVEAIDLKSLQDLLEDSVALLEYLQTPNELVIWIVAKDKIDVVRLAYKEKDLNALIDDYRTRMQKLAPVDESSRKLYDILIKPAAPFILQKRVLGIIPHGHLHYVSFASLTDGKAYLFEKIPLFYSPSASVLQYTFARKNHKKDGPVRVLALGNPDLGDFNYDLPLAEMEANAIRWNFPEIDILTRERAKESWIRKHIEDYQIIHIASHGEFDPINPLFSSLKLTGDTAQDGSLEVNEVFSLKINADLVTLSGCQTGLGELSGGDDVVGLNRAFIYAGTHALLSSLWRVSDISTAILTKHFYRNYVSENKAESLRKAQALVKSFYPHPSYWAAFNLTGDYR